MTVSRRLRFEILRRDSHACRYCGDKAPDVKLTVDHVIPVALGGGDEPNNLVTACADCNSGKSSTSPDTAIVEDVDATAMLFAKAMDRAAAHRRQHHELVAKALATFDRKWLSWYYGGKEANTFPRDDDWERSLCSFFDAGLDLTDLLNFIPVAMRSKANVDKVWRYFCGCCWNEITDRQEMARRLIEDGKV